MTNIVKYKGAKDNGIDLADAEITYTLKLADGEGATVGALSNDTVGTTTEDGYISINIGGTEYKVPFWEDD